PSHARLRVLPRSAVQSAMLRRLRRNLVRSDPQESVLPATAEQVRGFHLSLRSRNGTNVRMIQRGQDLGFTFEPGQVITIDSEFGWQHLEGDVAIQLRVTRAKHLAHPATAEGRENFI